MEKVGHPIYRSALYYLGMRSINNSRETNIKGAAAIYIRSVSPQLRTVFPSTKRFSPQPPAKSSSSPLRFPPPRPAARPRFLLFCPSFLPSAPRKARPRSPFSALSESFFKKSGVRACPLNILAVLLHSLNGTAVTLKREAGDIWTDYIRQDKCRKQGLGQGCLSFFCTR